LPCGIYNFYLRPRACRHPAEVSVSFFQFFFFAVFTTSTLVLYITLFTFSMRHGTDGLFLSKVYSELKSCSFSKCLIFLFCSVSTLHSYGTPRRCASAVKSVCHGIDVFMRKVVSLYDALNLSELTLKMGSVMHFTFIYTGTTLK